MPDEIVTIRIDFEANRRDMAQVLAEIQSFSEAADRASDASDRFRSSTRRMSRTTRDADEPMAAMRKRFSALDNSGKQLGKTLTRGEKAMTLFKKASRLLFFQLIALVAEFVITAATLASVNLLFKAGQWVAKGYNLALGAVGAALATVAVAAGVAVAAFREFNAAATAWQYKGANVYGSATGAAAAAMRGLYTDTNLATMGVTNLTQAYKTMSQQGRVTGAQTKALSGAMDFTARSQDQAKSFQAMANFVAILQKEGKVTGKASTAASGVSKEFAEAIKKSKGKDAASIMASMASGKLAQQAGVSGEFGSIKGTLVAQFKQITVALATDMADFGDRFLNDAREVLDGLFKNVRNVLARLAPEFTYFGKSKLFPAITTIGNALEKFSVTLVRKYLPMLFGASEWFKRTSASFMKSFNQFKHSLEKFREGSRIISETFKGPLLAIFRIFGRNAENLGYLAQDNEEQFKAWGGALENLIFAIGDWFGALKVAFTEALPVLTSIVNVLSKLINGMASLVRGIGTFKLGGGEGFLGLGGSGGGPSGTVGGGLGPGIGSMVALGLMFGGFKGSRTAYRMRRGGSVKDLTNQASVYGAQRAPRSMFGGIPAMFSRSRYTGNAATMRLTPAEVAANIAYVQNMKDAGRSYHDPGQFIRDRTMVKGAEMMGLGRDKAAFASNGFERTGFLNAAAYRAYMTGNEPNNMAFTSLGAPGTGRADLNRVELQNRLDAAEQNARATYRGGAAAFAMLPAAKQAKIIAEAQAPVVEQHMKMRNAQRDLMYGKGTFKEFLFGGQVQGSFDGVGTGPVQREGIFKTLSGKRMGADLRQAEQAARASSMGLGHLAPFQATELQKARLTAFNEMIEKDRQGAGKYVDKGTGEFRDAKARRAAERAFARSQFKGRTGAMFKGVGEGAQASMRKSFNPMMGMMGGMLLSTGVTNRIGDKDLRGAANNALGVGAMFGARGMGIAAGLTLMKSTSNTKAAMGGALAGAAVGKTISDTLAPVFGPMGPLAKAAIIGGSALIGGMVGVLRAQKNREKEARKIGAGIGERMTGQVVAAMVGSRVDPKTGRLIQAKGGSSFERGITAVDKQQRKVADMKLGDLVMGKRRVRATTNATDSYNANMGLNASRAQVLEGMKNTGVMLKSDYKKMQEYLRQAEGKGGRGDTGAMASFDAMVAGFQEDNLGYRTNAAGERIANTKIRRAEDFFARGTEGGTRGKTARGELFLPSDGGSLGRFEVQDIMMKRGNFVVKHLAKMTGKTEREIMELGSKMDVNLGDPTKSLTEQIGALGLVTRKTADEMKVAIRDIGTASTKVFDDAIARRAEILAFDASKNNLMTLGASATDKDFADYFRLLVSGTQADNPDNPFAVLSATKDFSEGNLGAFGKMDAGLLKSFKNNGQEQAKEAYGQQLSGISGLATQQVLGGMAEQGFVFKNVAAADRLKGLISGVFGDDKYGDQEKTNLLNFINTGQLLDKSGRLNLDKLSSIGPAGQALVDAINKTPGEGIFATETSKVYEIAGEIGFTTEAEKRFAGEIAHAITTAFDNKPEIFEGEAPQWWGDMKKYKWQAKDNTLQLVEGDTRTSRRGRIGDTSTSRALRGTMAAHAKFNSLLTGKRTVTSALRFDNLGSMSSDHAAGRAYDLTGDNLGQYQKMISNAGGFAEFHGWAGSRHLHVVPPIGNTRTPRSSLVAGTAGTMNQNVTLNVYGAPGQSETAIARQVVAALEQQQRAYRERT